MVIRNILLFSFVASLLTVHRAKCTPPDTSSNKMTYRGQGTFTPLLSAGSFYAVRAGFKFFTTSNTAIELSFGRPLLHSAEDSRIFAVSGDYYLRNLEVESPCFSVILVYHVRYRSDGSFLRDAYYLFPSVGSDLQWPFRLNVFFRLGPIVRISHDFDNSSPLSLGLELGVGYAF